MKRHNSYLPALLLIFVLTASGLACNAAGRIVEPEVVGNQESLVQAAVATIQAQTTTGNGALTTSQPGIVVDSSLEELLVNIYQRVNPSVVLVITKVDSLELGSGSGFVLDDLGHIVTNNHVVAEGDEYEIVFADGERRRATISGTDIDSDLAVLAVEDPPASAPPLTMGHADQIQVGQFVVALGSPFGQQGSMSLGIISGLARSLESQRQTGLGGTYSLPQVIQTDAPINPGNSGGPLLNLNGEVIGVNSAISSLTGSNSGVGFAIPVSAVIRITPALIAEGSYAYPYMGISASGTHITLDQQEAWGLPQASGVYVGSVTENSPAERAGLIAAGNDGLGGDLITAVDGMMISDFSELISYLVFEAEVGQTIQLTVLRDGQTLELPLTLGERP